MTRPFETSWPEPRQQTAKQNNALPRPEPKKPAEFRFTDWAMI